MTKEELEGNAMAKELIAAQKTRGKSPIAQSKPLTPEEKEKALDILERFKRLETAGRLH